MEDSLGVKEIRRRVRRYLRKLKGKKDEHKYIYKPNLQWLTDETFVRARSRGIRGIPDPRCFFLQSVIRSLKDVGGDVAECGVWNGKSSAFLLSADARTRDYHLFDSFEGLSEPTAEDILAATGRPHWRKGMIESQEDQTRRNLSDFKNVHFHPGWIPARFPDVSDRSFALVHLDVDLYEPTRDALAFFWPRIAVGGMLVCDDYGSVKCPGPRKALDEFFDRTAGARIVEIPTGQAMAIKLT